MNSISGGQVLHVRLSRYPLESEWWTVPAPSTPYAFECYGHVLKPKSTEPKWILDGAYAKPELPDMPERSATRLVRALKVTLEEEIGLPVTIQSNTLVDGIRRRERHHDHLL